MRFQLRSCEDSVTAIEEAKQALQHASDLRLATSQAIKIELQRRAESLLPTAGGDQRLGGRQRRLTPRACPPRSLRGYAVFSTPNFYFHAVTAYDIGRMKGVPLGNGTSWLPYAARTDARLTA